MRLAAMIIALVLFAAPALAFDPAPGSRAYPLAGTDYRTGRHVDLDDYAGKWVVLEFWASW